MSESGCRVSVRLLCIDSLHLFIYLPVGFLPLLTDMATAAAAPANSLSAHRSGIGTGERSSSGTIAV